jgi:hypothetical protein
MEKDGFETFFHIQVGIPPKYKSHLKFLLGSGTCAETSDQKGIVLILLFFVML